MNKLGLTSKFPMAEVKKEIQLEIAHVLFLDIVGYSKRSINEQGAVVDELTELVRTSDQYQKAEAAGRLWVGCGASDGVQCARVRFRLSRNTNRQQIDQCMQADPWYQTAPPEEEGTKE
jgi:hypothetical protein